jgi:hypothetical protein
VNIGERIRYVVTGSLPEHASQTPAAGPREDGSPS